METGADVVIDREMIPPLERVRSGVLVKKEDMSPELQVKVEQVLDLARLVLGEPEVVTNPQHPDWSMINSRTAYIPELEAHVMHIMAGGGESIKDGAALYNGTEIITPDVILETTDLADQERLNKYGAVTVIVRSASGLEQGETNKLTKAETGVDKILVGLQKVTTSR